MPYAVQADLSRWVTSNDLLKLTDDDRIGEINEDLVNGALDGAAAMMDTYLAKALELPIEDPDPDPYPELLVDLNAFFAVYRLRCRVGKPEEHLVNLHSEKMQTLAKIAAGEIELVAEEATTDARAHFRSQTRRVDRTEWLR